mgnify:CR=1 FL=1
MTIDFSLGYNSNKESNDFLRCFWAALRKEFGKAAWNLLPLRIENKIYLGHCDIGLGDVLDISLSYKIRGCLSAVSISVDDSISDTQLQRRLKGCITYARKNIDKLELFSSSLELDNAICFEELNADYFSLDANKLILNIYGYDLVDAKTQSSSLLKNICAWLSFDQLKYISIDGCAFQVYSDTVRQQLETQMKYRLRISDSVQKYLDDFISKPYSYENHLSDIDKAVFLFGQGLKYDELSQMSISPLEAYNEQAILCYMSALEVVTLKDVEPSKCECCGQLRYSIAKRVENLVYEVSQSMALRKMIADFYKNRSKFVHSGTMLSENNYTGISIPLMNKGYGDGLIMQCGFRSANLASIVKECIMWKINDANSKLNIIL